MDDEFERILSESFNNSNNNNIPISITEANNVNDIFVGNEVKTECIICYEDNIPCIKCFQCTAVYCKLCLTKIASDSNKCICAIQIKSNYSTLKKYNQDLIKKTRDNKIKQDKLKIKEEQRKTKIKNNKQNLNNTHNNSNNSNNINNSNNSNNSNNINNTDNNLTLRLNFLKDLTNNKIYNIDFKSFCNKVGNNIPNFDYFWDYENKTLTFYTIPNHRQELKNIIFNYDILNAENQGEIYIWILEILELSFNNFKTRWNTIADIMPQITHNNKTVMISKIVDICKA